MLLGVAYQYRSTHCIATGLPCVWGLEASVVFSLHKARRVCVSGVWAQQDGRTTGGTVVNTLSTALPHRKLGAVSPAFRASVTLSPEEAHLGCWVHSAWGTCRTRKEQPRPWRFRIKLYCVSEVAGCRSGGEER